MEKVAVNEMITTLEALCSSLQETAKNDPTSLEKTLKHAMEQTSEIITSAIPHDQRKGWLSELETLSDTRREIPPGDRLPTCVRSANQATARLRDTCASLACSAKDDNRSVECIHGCGVRFCCASRRRKCARQHAAVCVGIARKKALRRLGLVGEKELF